MPVINDDLWKRSLYQPGGGDAMLCYFLFGSFSAAIDFSFGEYDVAQIPSELELSFYNLREDSSLLSNLSSYFATKRFARANPSVYEKVMNASSCIKLSGTFLDPPSLTYLRETVGIIAGILNDGGIAVFDLMSLSWWTSSDWTQVFYAPRRPVPCSEVRIIFSESESGVANLQWAHTRGMRKFGRPDLSVENVDASQSKSISYILNYLIEDLCYGLCIPDSQEIELRNLDHASSYILCRHAGSMENPDFNNVHIELEMKYA